MHLASLVNVPVVSVWGATHPSAGFMGWGQKLSNVMSVDLPCRPCSIYGNKKCVRGDFACMNSIAPDAIVEKVLSVLNAEKAPSPEP
jgi:ADP-heptose:LPS heptosyltransferase